MTRLRGSLGAPVKLGGTVKVWALGFDRFSVRALGREQLVAGFDAARQTAHALAGGFE
jgi:hypothetical protein